MDRLSWQDVYALATQLRARWPFPVEGVYGVPSGGAPVAVICADEWNVPVLDEPRSDCLVVDDVIDSGTTMQRYLTQGFRFDALLQKATTPSPYVNGRPTYTGWVQFPWEADHAPTDAVRRLLQFLGEDPTREGLVDTPARVLRSLQEMTRGYTEEPTELLRTVFSADHDQMILLRNIPFTSLCEHHLLPFSGVATVAYLPAEGHIVGLSKLARLVLCFARRLQIQERLTQQIARTLQEVIAPLGVGVIVRAVHQCMTCRGVALTGTEMVTSALTGLFFTNPTVRQEFLSLATQTN